MTITIPRAIQAGTIDEPIYSVIAPKSLATLTLSLSSVDPHGNESSSDALQDLYTEEDFDEVGQYYN